MFTSRRKDCPVLKHSRVSEVFKGFNVHDFEHYGQRSYDFKWEFSLCHSICVIYDLFMLTLKKLLENAFRFETDVVLNILCLADFSCVV